MTDNSLTQNSLGNRDLFKVVMIVMQGLILPGVFWVVMQLIEQGEAIVRLEERLTNQASQVAGQYTDLQAEADWRNQTTIDTMQNRKVERLQEQLNSISLELRSLRRLDYENSQRQGNSQQ